MALIELKNINFTYEEEDKPVFENMDFQVNKGEVCHLSWGNGAGKSTLFKIINGLLFPEKGDYIFDGVKIDKKYLKNEQNLKGFHKRIGFLFQNVDSMLFNPTVYDEVAFGLRQMKLDEEEVKARTMDCLKLLEIEDLKDKSPYHLSGGQKKKVAFAAVMSLNPEVYVLDEPYNDLDDEARRLLAGIIEDLNKVGKTIIYAGH